jgi:hypothetical protein
MQPYPGRDGVAFRAVACATPAVALARLPDVGDTTVQTSAIRAQSPVGAQRRSCSLSVLMQQLAEQITPTYFARLICPWHGLPGRTVWRLKPKRPVWTVPVVVPHEDPEHVLQVATTDDQQPVQALGADRANPSLLVRICLRCPHGRHQHLGALGAEYVIEAEGELGIPITQQEPHLTPLFAQHQ